MPRASELSRQDEPPARAGAHSSAGEGGRQGGYVIGMQRGRLLRAMVEVVGEGGLDGASVGAVCKQAGVSRRTFYDLFEDREACLLAAFEQTVQWLAAWVVPAYESERKWVARTRAGLAALLEALDSAPGAARLCVVEALRAGTKVSAARKRVLDVFVEVVDRGRSESKQDGVLSPVGAQGVVGGAISVIQGRLLEAHRAPLVELLNPLMAMIVQPYLGAAAARRELGRSTPAAVTLPAEHVLEPFKDVGIRFTYRTARVLATIAASPGASNRVIADSAGIPDYGQMSRLLTRLRRAELVANQGQGSSRGEANAWKLTRRGQAVADALGVGLD